MLEVIITKGLPGSGKSTWAKSILDKHPNSYKRVNKDDLRAMLDNSKWSKDAEKFILKIRDEIILAALREGKHVIVDDTNLVPKHENHIRELVKSIGAGDIKVVVKDFTDVSVETCIERDLKRVASVGEKVIRQMYNQHLKPAPLPAPKEDPALPTAIICDLDGTLCLLNGRNPYDASTCDEDGLNLPVASVIKGRRVILVSGREDKYREPTLRFLEKHGIAYERLLMRKSGDTRKDSIIKKEIYDEFIRGQYNIKFVLDDRQQVVDMWRALGLTCMQVAEGDF